MEKKSESSKDSISLKVIIDWIVTLSVPIIPLISTKIFDSKDSDIFFKVFFISLITSFLVVFIWIRLFSDKKFNKLVNRIIKEVETKKDLERQKEELKRSLEWEKNFRSHAEKDNEKLEKENKKLQNERDQLRFVLPWCGISEKEVGIDGNISFFEWEKKPKIQKKREEIIKGTYEERREAERDVDSLSYQLEEECKISKDNQRVGDRRQKEWVIKYIEDYWNYINADRNTGKIKGKTIEQFLPDHWKDNLQKKEEIQEIIEEKYRLKKLIDEFANSKK